MNFLLTLKHWQLFILTFGIVVIAHITFMVVLLTTMNDSFFDLYLGIIFPAIMIFSLFIIFGWIGWVVKKLSLLIPEDIRPSFRWFWICYGYSCIALSLYFVWFGMLIRNKGEMPTDIFVILPFVFLTMISNLVIFFSTGRVIRMAEQKKKEAFTEYMMEFIFMFVFAMLGVWMLQPRVNKLYAELQKEITAP